MDTHIIQNEYDEFRKDQHKLDRHFAEKAIKAGLPARWFTEDVDDDDDYAYSLEDEAKISGVDLNVVNPNHSVLIKEDKKLLKIAITNRIMLLN
jgi:hypothetical protein